MSSFCGHLSNSTVISRKGILGNECFLDGLSFIPHLLFILVTLPFVIAWNKSQFGKMHVKTWVHFPGHELRWFVGLVLVVVNFAELGEGVISDSLYVGSHPHLFVPHLASICGSSYSLFYYHYVEMWNSPRFLLLLIVYWMFALVTKFLVLLNELIIGVGPEHMRVYLSLSTITIYIGLMLIELHVLRILRYAFFRERRRMQPPDDLANTEYVHSYSNLLSRITFFWVNNLLMTGFRHTLHMKDLGKLPITDWSLYNYKKLHKAFEDEKAKSEKVKKEPSMWRCYWKAFGPMMAFAGVFKLIGDLLSFVGPMCIRYIIVYVENRTQSNSTQPLPEEEQFVTVHGFFSNGFVLAFIAFITTVLQNSLLQMHYHLVIREGIRLRGALQALIFYKTLNLTTWNISSGQRSSGQIANHMSVDAGNLMMFFYMGHYMWALPLKAMVYKKSLVLSSVVFAVPGYSPGHLLHHMSIDPHEIMIFLFLIHFAWSVPLQIVITLVLLYLQLGYSALIGGALILFLSPIQYYVTKIYSRFQKKTMEYSDGRLKHINELFQGIKLVKLYGWESIFCQNIAKDRKKQIRYLLYGKCLNAVTMCITDGAPVLVTLVTFSLYPYISKEPLTADRTFTSLALFDILTIPLFIFPLVVNVIVNAVISSNRLLSFFLAPEVTGRLSDMKENEEQARDTKVEFYLNNFDYEVTVNPDIEEDVIELDSLKKPARILRAPSPQLEEIPEQPEVGFEGQSRNDSQHQDHEETDVKSGRKSPAVISVNSTERRSPSPSAGQHARSRSPRPEEKSESAFTKGQRKKDSLGSTSSKGINKVRHHSAGAVSIGGLSLCSDHDEDDFIDPNRGIGIAVDIKDGNFTWDYEMDKCELHDINFQADAGKLTIIVGALGSGKSSLLAAMLGEMFMKSGTAKWKPGVTVAYAAQKPWLLNASLKDNIIFGQPFDKKRYRRVIHACALGPDIDILPAGDETEIGEKGLTLSGGQKQRVSIARAMYSRSDVVIMDDPLSALDVHVGQHLFEDGFLRFMLKRHRTIILVTHQLQFVAYAHKIVRLENGRVSHQGTLRDIKEHNPELFSSWQSAIQHARRETERKLSETEETETESERRLLQHCMSTNEFQRQVSQVSMGMAVRDQDHTATSPGRSFYARHVSQISTQEDLGIGMSNYEPVFSKTITPTQSVNADEQSSPDSEEQELIDSPTEPQKQQLMSEEEREEGTVSWHVYLEYLQACLVPLALLVVLLHLARVGTKIASDFWLTIWSAATLSNSDYTINYYVHVYVALGLTAVVLTLAVTFLSEFTALKAAVRLHNNMLKNIVLAPMRFFDTTPIGRIINRFAGDTHTIDEKLPTTIESLFRTSLMCFAAILVNAIATPYFLIAAVPIIILYYFLQHFYRTSSRELQRLDSISKSPIFVHFSETLDGLTTIRAYRDEVRFRQQILNAIDSNNTAFLWLNTANRWLGIRLDHMGALIVLTSALSTITAALFGHINSGVVGLAIAYGLMMSSHLNWVVRSITDTEMQMNAVERTVHYTKIPPEIQVQPDSAIKVASDWPSHGKIELRSVAVRYDSTLEAAVKDASLTIDAGQKVGICGRTGSGKSSLTLALFRLIDIYKGQILIDDVDICTVPLEILRSRLSIIPQDPMLFHGTVRYNLNPEGGRTDQELWHALEIAQLKPTIEVQAHRLDAIISEGGDNFSVGQRQLFCLARAFLRNSHILIMDEATASIDLKTDALIQQVIKTSFKDRTVITIAHRVATILDCEHIVVMDEGKIVEQGHPKDLLKKDGGTFASLVHSHSHKHHHRRKSRESWNNSSQKPDKDH